MAQSWHSNDSHSFPTAARFTGDAKGSLYTVTSRITRSDGLTTLFDKDGSAFIVHELPDQYLPDPPTKDGPGGARIACGVIVRE